MIPVSALAPTGEDMQSNFRFRAARAKFSSADFAGREAMRCGTRTRLSSSREHDGGRSDVDECGARCGKRRSRAERDADRGAVAVNARDRAGQAAATEL
jgi:hypothetical protein